jgi:hypothetical protein
MIKKEAQPQISSSVQIPMAAVIFFTLALAGTSFAAGLFWTKLKSDKGSASVPVTTANANTKEFAPTKSAKPDFRFFVMSFCPFGNQAEDAIKPVAELLADKANIRPQYIFDKIEGNLSDYCKPRMGDPNQCDTYVKNSNGRFKDVAECKKYIADSLQNCTNEKNYLKIGNNYYASLHGRVEANQDIREMCAWNQTDDKKSWWKFVDTVNKNCDSQNADTCWEQPAKDAGFDVAKITECFNKDAGRLIEDEIALTTKYQVSGSPTMILNEAQFPPENAYTQDGSGSIKIGKKVFTQNQFRTPNAIKEAVCAAFDKAPKECKTELAQAAANPAAAQGGCN